LGGTAAVLTGLFYGAAGYLDRPGISGYDITFVSVLSIAIPALFLGGLMGLRLRILLATQTSLASGAGFVLGCFGAAMGVVGVLESGQATYSKLTEVTNWWWVPLLAGLTLMGLGAFRREGLGLLGAVVLISGFLGWVSVLTDAAFPGVLMPLRPVHVAFAAAFCLSFVVWGLMMVVPQGLTRPKS